MASLIGETYIGTDSRKHKDYRDIFSMACAEVATPDSLFQIIARRLNDAKDRASAGAQVVQFERKCVAHAVTDFDMI